MAANVRDSGLWGVLGDLRRVLRLRFDKSAIASFDALAEFVRTRSSHVAQTALFGYLKTRMGTRYPAIFEDDFFQDSINNAKVETFTACLSDLTVFAAGLIAREAKLGPAETARLAEELFAAALSRTIEESALQIDATSQCTAFAARCRHVAWGSAGIGETAFTESPAALVRSAPIADELKQFDTEIVTNSVRFRWRDVRDQLRRRIDPAALRAEWSARQG